MEFTFNGNTYRAGKIPAMQQFHIARRLAPSLEKLLAIPGEDLSAAQSGAEAETDDKQMRAVLAPILQAVYCLPDEDAEYIIHTCLNAVEMKQPGGAWAPVRHAGVIMFPLELPAMLFFTYQAFEANLAGFIGVLPCDLRERARTHPLISSLFPEEKTG